MEIHVWLEGWHIELRKGLLNTKLTSLSIGLSTDMTRYSSSIPNQYFYLNLNISLTSQYLLKIKCYLLVLDISLN